jgi:hypothetical protein
LQNLHRSDDELELYALRRLPEARVAEVEEHLLLCVSCQDRLDDVEKFALSMREVIAGEPEAQIRTDWFAWFKPNGLRLPTLAWAGGLAAIVLGFVLYLHSGRLAPLASLQLTALRGDVQSTTRARETDITLGDAPSAPSLRAEIVDGVGARVWTGGFEGGDQIRLTKELEPGNYFVRLYDDNGKLLHEYGFLVRSVR